jgi:hypothetical protein
VLAHEIVEHDFAARERLALQAVFDLLDVVVGLARASTAMFACAGRTPTRGFTGFRLALGCDRRGTAHEQGADLDVDRHFGVRQAAPALGY